jgi:hypothetical protein
MSDTITDTTVSHVLKSWPNLFEPLSRGEKKHDLRRGTDRSFVIGDLIHYREFDPARDAFTGRECFATITYITSSAVPCALFDAGLNPDFVILSVALHDHLS